MKPSLFPESPLGRTVLAVALVCATLLPRSAQSAPSVDIHSQSALLHLGSIDSFDISEGGTGAAKQLLQAIEADNQAAAKSAWEVYEKLIPDENFGGEYTALQWFAEYFMATPEKRKEILADPLVDSFFRFFADNKFANLREYLKRKYHIQKFGDEDTIQAHQREASLEDFILFNNPVRDRWEKTGRMLDSFGIQPGESIADVGSGPGFFSFKFARMVGPQGKVFAVEVNSDHVKYVKDTARKLGVDNIVPVQSRATDIGLKDERVDMVYMCSLYHIIYTVFDEPDKDAFIGSIKKALKPGGRFVLVDNGPVADETLPYHGPYISRELIIGQLAHYGFKLVREEQFIPQRYILTFRVDENAVASVAEPGPLPAGSVRLPIPGKESLIHIPNDLSAKPLIAARKPARALFNALEKKDLAAAATARDAFAALVLSENVGDEYSAFVWVCDYLLADTGKQAAMLADPMVASYHRRLAKDDYQQLRDYLSLRYFLHQGDDVPVDQLLRPPPSDGAPAKTPEGNADAGAKEKAIPGTQAQPTAAGPGSATTPAGEATPSGNEFVSINDSLAVQFLNKGRDPRPEVVKRMSAERHAYWRDFILFNNPNRIHWEKSDKMLEAVGAKSGQTIADVGCGAGYFSMAFARQVGPGGKVLAIDTNKEHLDYVKELAGEMKLPNIQAIEGKLDNAMLPEGTVDAVFMCSLYTPVYTTGMNKVTRGFLESIKRGLKPDGRLIVVDNAVVAAGERPYHGPYMAKEIIEAQLKFFGFKLVQTHQFIPQRYMLVFSREKATQP